MSQLTLLTNGVEQMQSTSQALEQLAAVSALLRHDWAHDERLLVSGHVVEDPVPEDPLLPPDDPLLPPEDVVVDPADVVVLEVVTPPPAAVVVPEAGQVEPCMARTSVMSEAVHVVAKQRAAEFVNEVPQMQETSHADEQPALERAPSKQVWAQDESLVTSGQFAAAEVVAGAAVVVAFVVVTWAGADVVGAVVTWAGAEEVVDVEALVDEG